MSLNDVGGLQLQQFFDICKDCNKATSAEIGLKFKKNYKKPVLVHRPISALSARIQMNHEPLREGQ